jgi:hypothetical protein
MSDTRDNQLMSELYLISLLERVHIELRHCRVSVSAGGYDNLHTEVKAAIDAYQAGKWNLYVMDATTNFKQQAEIDRLRNPWVSVEGAEPHTQYWGAWVNQDGIYYDHTSFDGHNWWNINSSNKCIAPDYVMTIIKPPTGGDT